jgi:DNA mismatch repair protein MutL
MGRIQLLPEEVASQVAAGEVIERPASVVKELVENSIDAGARKIEVMIRRGGVSTIRVVDDGAGMDRDDALLCLERHATSKIRTGNDLAAIATLGFRGEALPSIASVSRFRLTTREHDVICGTDIAIAGGKIERVIDSGEAPGTQVEVRSLFYNLPARRKFLRSESTETSHVEHQLQLQAIGHPETGFILVNDDRLIHQLPPVTNLLDRIRDLSGQDLVAQLLEIPAGMRDGISIHGFIGKPGVSRSNRSQQIVFVNGRAVENSTINFALREGYHTALMKGQYPLTFLFLNIDPALVDVNVHPAKREVRFRHGDRVRDALVEAVRETLNAARPAWQRSFQTSPPSRVPEKPGEIAPLIPTKEQVALRRDWAELPANQTSPSVQPAPSPPVAAQISGLKIAPESASPEQQQEFKILGVLGNLYVLMENEDGLVLVDQHAAHERILFEELRRKIEDEGVPAQRLLMPITIQLAPRDCDWVIQNMQTLQRMGIGIELFGAGTFKIDALPQFMRTGEPLQMIRDILDELRQTSRHTSRLRLGEDVIATTVCRHAVKARDFLREPELVRLIQDLLRCELPYCCPHGRPTMIQISYSELEKKFGRRT